ncbi:hypothetical protein GCM10010254_16070 [Streptomyces chromofuscus]|nr:hypothetical protein GCM10010254_16070 [Streptomyces chromofuscus]
MAAGFFADAFFADTFFAGTFFAAAFSSAAFSSAAFSSGAARAPAVPSGLAPWAVARSAAAFPLPPVPFFPPTPAEAAPRTVFTALPTARLAADATPCVLFFPPAPLAPPDALAVPPEALVDLPDADCCTADFFATMAGPFTYCDFARESCWDDKSTRVPRQRGTPPESHAPRPPRGRHACVVPSSPPGIPPSRTSQDPNSHI